MYIFTVEFFTVKLAHEIRKLEKSGVKYLHLKEKYYLRISKGTENMFEKSREFQETEGSRFQ